MSFPRKDIQGFLLNGGQQTESLCQCQGEPSRDTVLHISHSREYNSRYNPILCTVLCPTSRSPSLCMRLLHSTLLLSFTFWPFSLDEIHLRKAIPFNTDSLSFFNRTFDHLLARIQSYLGENRKNVSKYTNPFKFNFDL